MLVWYLVNRPSLWRSVSWGCSRICGIILSSTSSIFSSMMTRVSNFLIKIISANTVHSGLYYWSQQCLIAAFRRTAHNADKQHYWVCILWTYILRWFLLVANNYWNGFRILFVCSACNTMSTSTVATLPSTFKKILTSLSKLSLSTTDLCSPH